MCIIDTRTHTHNSTFKRFFGFHVALLPCAVLLLVIMSLYTVSIFQSSCLNGFHMSTIIIALVQACYLDFTV